MSPFCHLALRLPTKVNHGALNVLPHRWLACANALLSIFRRELSAAVARSHQEAIIPAHPDASPFHCTIKPVCAPTLSLHRWLACSNALLSIFWVGCQQQGCSMPPSGRPSSRLTSLASVHILICPCCADHPLSGSLTGVDHALHRFPRTGGWLALTGFCPSSGVSCQQPGCSMPGSEKPSFPPTSCACVGQLTASWAGSCAG